MTKVTGAVTAITAFQLVMHGNFSDCAKALIRILHGETEFIAEGRRVSRHCAFGNFASFCQVLLSSPTCEGCSALYLGEKGAV